MPRVSSGRGGNATPPRALPGRLFPGAAPGARVGLFGGSFDPAHEGHLAVAAAARAACRLDRVIWLVTPRSPLKPDQAYASLADRLAGARRAARGRPWLGVSGAEAALGTRFTADTLRAVRRRRPDLRLVWIMGADSLASFHRWRDWRGIAASAPMLVVSRPGHGRGALRSRAARTLAGARLPPGAASSLPCRAAPAWIYLPGVSVPVSSTAIRSRERPR